MNVVITGGSGFVGSHLCQLLVKQGHTVTIVGNTPPKQNAQGIAFIKANLLEEEVPPIFAECEAIIHLAGAPIFHRWTKSYKQLILDSRIKTAQKICLFLSQQTKRPKVFISASATGFYGNRGDNLLTETAKPGSDFLSSVCIEWEKAAEKFSSLGMRVVSVRTSTVLGSDGGALAKMIPLFRWGLGGKLGNGKQWFPWIHIDDLTRIYAEALQNPQMTGAINAVAPGKIRNVEFTKTLGNILKRPTFLPVPSFALRLCLGAFANALLSSQRVMPEKLQQMKFPFLYPKIEKALLQISG